MRKIIAISILLLVSLLACTKQETSQSQVITGKMVVKVQEPPSEAKKEICENAQTYDLCDELNIKFIEGYRQQCCDKYGICCK